MSQYLRGYIPSKRKHTDLIYGQLVGLNEDKLASLPSSFFYPRIPTNLIYNQTIGDCVGQSERYIRIIQNFIATQQWVDYSGDFIYSICKTLDGQPTSEGTEPQYAQQVSATIGICARNLYPDLTSNDNRPTPSQQAYADAKARLDKTYAKIQTVDEIKHALIEQGPVQLAVLVTDTFEQCESGGFIPLGGTPLGGHAICADGFDDNMTHKYADGTVRTGFVRVLNSWSANWGDGGYGYIPYDFFTFVTDMGMHFFMEAWSSVGQVTPTQPVTPQTTIQMWIGHDTALVNGQSVSLDTPPMIVNGRTMTPARFVAENLGANVEWDANNQLVTITK